MINAIQIALSGLLAASRKTETVASNIANMNTAGSLSDPDNAPYRAGTTQQTAITDGNGNALGVKAEAVAKSPPFVPSYDPDSPFANEDGLIGVPNVSLAEEIVNLNIAETTFRANLKTIEAASEMNDALLGMFDEKV